MKNYKKDFAPLVLLIVIVVVVIGGVVYFYKSKQSVTESTDVINTSQDTDSSIKLLSVEIPNNISARKQFDQISDCQPANFDPNTSRVTEEWVSMERQSVINLGGGYTLTPYMFGCASSYDYVLEIEKDDKRHALYQNVTRWSLSDDKKSLFLNNVLKNQSGKYDFLTRIINIQSKQAIQLPNVACASSLGFWNKDNLVTYSDLNMVEYGDPQADNYKTKICQWTKEGKLLNQFETKLYWGAASAAFLSDQIGFLPTEPNIFYAYSNNLEYPKSAWATSTPQEGRTCYLYLQDITDQNRNKKIKIADADMDTPYCPRMEFNLNNFKFSLDKVDYKLVDQNEK